MPVIRPTIEGRGERGEGRETDCRATCSVLGAGINEPTSSPSPVINVAIKYASGMPSGK